VVAGEDIGAATRGTPGKQICISIDSCRISSYFVPKTRMAGSTEFSESSVSGLQTQGAGRMKPALWSKVKRVVTRAIFWSYERGSWQYDIILLVILAFIFLTPAKWFHDQPRLQLSDLRHVQGIVEVAHNGHDWIYQVDERLVDSMIPLAPKDAMEQLLQQRVHSPFVLKSVQPVLDKNGVVLGYTVVVDRK
jgi:hypothetical protein